MRMSCNGCRILRKGCSEDCSIKPCLQWIKTPESQANATVFLAKFYGRAGLMNLINAGPHNLRPAIFRSLLYEACGRIVNPIYGSIGLLWSESWQLCQTAVENVLKGKPIIPITCEAAADGCGPPLKAYDICHVSNDEDSKDLMRPKTSRYKFKRSAGKPKPSETGVDDAAEAARLGAKRKWINYEEFKQSSSHEESELSHQSEADVHVDGDVSKENETVVLFRDEPEAAAKDRAELVEESELGLELTLGLESLSRAPHVVPVKKRRVEASEFCGGSLSFSDGASGTELWLA